MARRGNKDIRVGAARIDFIGNTVELEKAQKRAKNIVNKFNRQMRPVIRRMKQFGKYATGMGAAVAYAGSRLSAQIDRLAKFARSVRGTTADMQVLTRVADLNGVEMQKLEMALKKFDVTLATISDNTAYKMVTDQWEKLGLSIDEVLKLPLAERVQTIIEAIQKYIPVTDRAAVSAQLFGTRNGSMIAQFASADFDRARKELEDYGGALNQVQAREVQKMQDQMGELRLAFNNFAVQLVAKYAPAIRRWAREVSNSLKPGGKLRALVESITGAFATSIKVIDQFILNVRKIVGQNALFIGSMAVLASGIVKTVGVILTMVKGVYQLGVAIFSTAGVMQGAATAAALFTSGIGSLVAVAGAVVVGIAAVKTAINFYQGATEESNLVTTRATLLTDKLSHAYDNLASSIKGSTDRSKENLEQMRKNLTGQVTGMTVSATEMLFEIEKDPEYKNALKMRDDALAILSRPVSSMHKRAQGKWREQQKQATRDLMEAGRIIEDKKQDYTNLVAKAKEANDLLVDLGIELASHQLGAPAESINAGNIPQALQNYIDEHQRKLLDFGREIEEKQIGVTTQSYDRLRDARIWFEDMTYKIKEAGVGFEHLHAKAQEAFETMARHAQGIMYPLESLVMVLDNFADRFQDVWSTAVDDFLDGTDNMGKAFRKMIRQIAKDFIWLNLRSGLNSIQGHFLRMLGTPTIPTPGGLPGASPAGALGGTINANNFAGAFNRGGHIPSGQYGLVGEGGAEFVRGPADVISANKSAAMMRRGRNGIDVNMNVLMTGGAAAVQQAIRNQFEIILPGMVQQIQGGIINNLSIPSAEQDAVRGAV